MRAASGCGPRGAVIDLALAYGSFHIYALPYRGAVDAPVMAARGRQGAGHPSCHPDQPTDTFWRIGSALLGGFNVQAMNPPAPNRPTGSRPVVESISHDQNFKNLILDYPRQALFFFAPQEAQGIDESVVITPIRQEQLKNRLGDRFHELDVPLLVEWPDGRREALLFVLEEESDPARFSIHRLVVYSATLAELYRTTRVVPVVIFLRGGGIPRSLTLGSEHHAYLRFDYLACVLADTPAERWMDSDNLVARLNLPNMRWPRKRRVELYAQAIRGLLSLEPDIEKRLKYLDFVDIYTALDDNERRLYAELYPQENRSMVGLRERVTQELTVGFKDRWMQDGAVAVLSRQLERRFGPLDPAVTERLQKASASELERWVDNFVDARTLDEVFDTH
ncbi:MAG: hypothetical protein QM766_21975 [Burkholderiaceae bacterium]